MHTKRIWFPIGVIAVLFVSYFGTECALSKSCQYSWLLHDLSPSLLDPLFMYSLWILPVFALSIFVHKQTYRTWGKFTFWWLLYSLLLLGAFEVSPGGWFVALSPSREQVAGIFGFLYTLISLIIIGWQTFKRSKRK